MAPDSRVGREATELLESARIVIELPVSWRLTLGFRCSVTWSDIVFLNVPFPVRATQQRSLVRRHLTLYIVSDLRHAKVSDHDSRYGIAHSVVVQLLGSRGKLVEDPLH